MFEQQADHLDVTVLGSFVECCLATFTAGVNPDLSAVPR